MRAKNLPFDSADTALEDIDAAAIAYTEALDNATPVQRRVLRDGFVRLCLPIARRLARRYRGRGESLEDIEQVARLGLIKATNRYDPQRGSFTAYAIITILGEIKRYFRDTAWDLHVPRRLQEQSIEVRNASIALTTTLARTPTPAELAAHLHIRTDDVLAALETAAGYTSLSLNAPSVRDEAGELGDQVGDVDPDLELVDDRITVAELIQRLPTREQRLLAMRFYGNLTQADIGADLGISQMQVSRLLNRALTWLRAAMLSDTMPPWDGADTPEHTLRLSIERTGPALTVVVRGEVDRDTAQQLRVCLRQAIGTTGIDAATIDLAGVPLADAAAVAVLIDAAGAAAVAGIRLSFTGVQPHVRRVLTTSGMAGLSSRQINETHP
jgi:RNA polymerase sigma-B factor